MPVESDLERYTGARATPELVGRSSIRAQIDAAVYDAAPGPAIVILHGAGGIGKTRLLRDTLSREGAHAHILRARRPVDLYDIRFHSTLDLANAIYLALDEHHTAFHRFEQAYTRQQRAQASGDSLEIVAKTQQALDAFDTDLCQLAEQGRVVIALDTIERVVYGAAEQRPPFQIAESWRWMTNSAARWGNVTIVAAGRPQVKHLFDELRQLNGVGFTDVEIEPFSEAETLEYLEVVAHAAAASGETAVAQALTTMTAGRKRLVHRYSGGYPILLSLLADYISVAGFGQLPQVFDNDIDNARARTLLEEQVIERLMGARVKDTLQMLGRAPKGVDADLLAKLLGVTVDQARRSLNEIEPLSFVKVRDGRYYLHDEMYAILYRQIYSSPTDADGAYRVHQALIEWYQSQIDQRRQELDRLYAPIEHIQRTGPSQNVDHERIAIIQQEIQQLLIDQLYYELQRDPLDGFKEYFRDSFYAIFRLFRTSRGSP